MLRKRFNGLDSLRGIAALAVLLHHVERYHSMNSGPSLFDFNISQYFIHVIGKVAVLIFFALSGFLISFLLFKELQAENKIDIKRFVYKRIARIWPVYFLMVIVSFFIYPIIFHNAHWLNYGYYGQLSSGFEGFFSVELLFFLGFVPNIALTYFPPIVGVSHLWSIGVEQQFYLIWPFVILLSKKIKFLYLLIACFLVYLLIVLAWKQFGLSIFNFMSWFHAEALLLGALAGFLSFKEIDVIKANARLGFWISLSILLFFSFVPIPFSSFVIAFSASFMILCMTYVVKRDLVAFSFLGDISYGLYVYHPLIMHLTGAALWSMYGVDMSLFSVILHHGLVLSLTIMFSWLSFRFFEKNAMKFMSRVIQN